MGLAGKMRHGRMQPHQMHFLFRWRGLHHFQLLLGTLQWAPSYNYPSGVFNAARLVL